MKKLFYELNMSWKNTILYSIGTAMVIAILNVIPGLQNTSFTAPAATTELWFFLALIVIMNAKSSKEAVLKTFIYFLISQPLIYLIEVPFTDIGFGLFKYYYYWFIFTILTIPGAWIAYQVKRDNVISSIILSVACVSIVSQGSYYLMNNLIYYFPRYLLTVIYCYVIPFVFIFTFLSKKRERIIAIILTVVVGGLLSIYVNQYNYTSVGEPLPDGEWKVISSDVPYNLYDGGISINPEKNGKFKIVVENQDGNQIIYDITVEKGNTIIHTTGEEIFEDYINE